MTVGAYTATGILIAGVADDLRTRKYHNWLFLASAGIGLAVTIASQGLWGANSGFMGLLAGIAIFLPLVLLKVLGAGDMKLLAAVGTATSPEVVFSIALFSVVWGAIFGVLQVTLRGELGGVVRNLGAMAMNRGRLPEKERLHTIPFSVALLVGWLTYLVYQGAL